MPSKNSLRILEETKQTIQTIGENETIKVLKKARETHTGKENPILACIFAVIYKEFKITKKNLIYSKDRKNGVRVNAIHVCCFLISQYIKQYRQVDIANMLEKDEGDVSRYIKRINTLNPKIAVDRELIHKIECAKKSLEEKLKKINS